MRVKISALSVLLLAALVVSASSCRAQAQATQPAKAASAARPELAINYNYLRSNAPPGGGANFGLDGGSIDFAWPLSDSRFAMVGDIAATHASGITATGYDLTLSTYLAGLRYSPLDPRFRLQPYAQALAGVAHASGSLVEGPTATVLNFPAATAFEIGGGINLKLNRRFALRLIQADYLPTTFDNGSNDRQNNLRIGAGMVIRF